MTPLQKFPSRSRRRRRNAVSFAADGRATPTPGHRPVGFHDRNHQGATSDHSEWGVSRHPKATSLQTKTRNKCEAEMGVHQRASFAPFTNALPSKGTPGWSAQTSRAGTPPPMTGRFKLSRPAGRIADQATPRKRRDPLVSARISAELPVAFPGPERPPEALLGGRRTAPSGQRTHRKQPGQGRPCPENERCVFNGICPGDSFKA
jgi:hypothetical protein